MLPNSLLLLAEFSSLLLWDWGTCFLAGCPPGATLPSHSLPTFFDFLHLQVSNSMWNPSHALNLWLLLMARENYLFFKRLIWWSQIHPVKLPILRSTDLGPWFPLQNLFTVRARVWFNNWEKACVYTRAGNLEGPSLHSAYHRWLGEKSLSDEFPFELRPGWWDRTSHRKI